MADFAKSLTAKLARRGIAASEFCNLSNTVERRIVKEYGAVFLNADAEVEMPDRCCFKNESEVAAFQATLKISKRTIGGCAIELQQAAMNALLKATDAVDAITPKGACPARRSFADVQISWDETVKDAAHYWRANPNSEGKTLSAEETENLESFTGERQIKLIFELEEQNFFFHPDRTRSIAVYTAIPGASQHLLMLALDIKEYADEKVRGALDENGWIQTVFRDRPHFTYLGLKRKDLPSLGLKSERFEDREFWIPNI
jgi:hypothetical protein